VAIAAASATAMAHRSPRRAVRRTRSGIASALPDEVDDDDDDDGEDDDGHGTKVMLADRHGVPAMADNERMDGPGFDVLGFLAEPLRPASVATVTRRGRSALAMMWFVLAEGRLWFHTPVGGGPPSPFLRAAAEGREVAVMVATFNPPDDVRQVRVSGPARLEERDDARVRAIYDRYIDEWTPGWHGQATSADYRLWSMRPERGMAVTYAGLADRPVFRWSGPWLGEPER
jgi:hypothetical protein